MKNITKELEEIQSKDVNSIAITRTDNPLKVSVLKDKIIINGFANVSTLEAGDDDHEEEGNIALHDEAGDIIGWIILV